MNTSKPKTISSLISSSEKMSNDIITELSPLSNLESESTNSSNINWWVILLIFIVLAFLGFNIFVYLAKGTQGIVDTFSPVLKLIGYNTAIGTQKVINTSATGIQHVSKNIADATSLGPAPNPNTPSNNSPTTTSGDEYNSSKESSLDNSLNSAINSQNKKKQIYNADESSSSTQSSKIANKSGWCYIGEERGFRSCIGVGPSDVCMSGDIFPTQDICVNPNLRV